MFHFPLLILALDAVQGPHDIIAKQYVFKNSSTEPWPFMLPKIQGRFGYAPLVFYGRNLPNVDSQICSSCLVGLAASYRLQLHCSWVTHIQTSFINSNIPDFFPAFNYSGNWLSCQNIIYAKCRPDSSRAFTAGLPSRTKHVTPQAYSTRGWHFSPFWKPWRPCCRQSVTKSRVWWWSYATIRIWSRERFHWPSHCTREKLDCRH